MAKSDCLRSRFVAGNCARCQQPMDVAHLSLITSGGAVCASCCSHCTPQPQGAIARAVVVKGHPEAGEGRSAL